MPNVTAIPRNMGEEVVIEFVDSVGTTEVTYTFPETNIPQDTLKLYNLGAVGLLVSVGNQTNITVNAFEETTITNEFFTSFKIKAQIGQGSFRAVSSYSGVDEIDEQILTDKNDGFVSVKEYKQYALKDANGNITDWKPAIVRAITKAKLSNGTVVLPKGIVPFTPPITIDRRISLIGYGRGSADTTAGTVLKKLSNDVGIKILVDYVDLRDFLLTTDLTTDTSSGIEIGGSLNEQTANETVLTGIMVTKQGGDGIWLRNGNCCKIEATCNQNKSHGLRLESSTSGYDNVNANYITLQNAMGNSKSGLKIFQSYENTIHATCQGNYEYGVDINTPNNTIFGYTEGNVLGSMLFGVSAFGCYVIAKLNEGSPIYNNHMNFVMEKLSTGVEIKNFGVYKFKQTSTAQGTPIWGSVPAGGYIDKTIINAYGLKTTDAVYVSPDGALEPGLVYYAFVSTTETVTIRLMNTTASAITPTNRMWRVEGISRS